MWCPSCDGEEREPFWSFERDVPRCDDCGGRLFRDALAFRDYMEAGEGIAADLTYDLRRGA